LTLLVTGTASSTPSLGPVSLTPLTLRGAGFVPGEAVRVELAPGRGRKRAVRTAHATAAGSFRVRYALVALEPCHGIVIATATGSRGSRATWKRACRPPYEQPPSVG
jgi:hypothetical protein